MTNFTETKNTSEVQTFSLKEKNLALPLGHQKMILRIRRAKEQRKHVPKCEPRVDRLKG
jgi:hypothetical protein